MTRRVLVTGGAGFVGSHVADALVARGDEVVVVDDFSTGDRANLRSAAALVVADVSDGRALARSVGGQRFDSVVHCAAKTKVVESMEKPDLYRRVIVDGTRNVLDLALASGAHELVNISTGGAIYGETPRCADENAPLEAVSPYGRYKAEAETLLHDTALRPVTLRLANVYGPRQRDDLEGGVISIFLGRWRAKKPLTVFGTGTAQRDYVYVGDVVEAILAALDGAASGVFNIGTGVATSVNDLISVMTEVLGPPPGVERVAPRPGEIERSCVDASKAAELPWRARTALRQGIALTAEAV